MCGQSRCTAYGTEAEPANATGMHAECFELMQRFAGHRNERELQLHKVLKAFDRTYDYSFPISASSERRREQAYQETLAQRLWTAKTADIWNHDANAPQLPLEIWMIVAGHLVRTSAFVSRLVLSSVSQESTSTALAESRTSKPRGEWDVQCISLEMPVYAAFTAIEGLYYVQRLYSGDDDQEEAEEQEEQKDGTFSVLVYPGSPIVRESGALGVSFFVGSDHLGIRRIVFFPLFCECNKFSLEDTHSLRNEENGFCHDKGNYWMSKWACSFDDNPIDSVSWERYTISFDAALEPGTKTKTNLPVPTTLHIHRDDIKARAIVLGQRCLHKAERAGNVNNGDSNGGNDIQTQLYLQRLYKRMLPRRYLWPTPPTGDNPIIVKNASDIFSSSKDDQYRMRHVEFNGPDTVGYSVACTYDGTDIVSILAHKRNERNDAHVEAYTEAGMDRCIWVSVAMAPGEVVRRAVIHICRERKSVNRPSTKSLEIATNFRSLIFGSSWGKYLQSVAIPTPSSLSTARPYVPLCSITVPPDRPSGIAFSRLDPFRNRQPMEIIAAESHPPPIRNLEPGPPPPKDITLDMDTRKSPLSKPHAHASSRTAFRKLTGLYSCCSLEDVVSIQVCTNPTLPENPIVGMRVSYTNESGRVDAYLGQWRFDWAANPKSPNEVRILPDSSGLYVCYMLPLEGSRRKDKSSEKPDCRQCQRYIASFVADPRGFTTVHGSTPPCRVSPDDRTRAKQRIYWHKHNANGRQGYLVKWCLVPWHGILEWWFTADSFALYHNGQPVHKLPCR